MSEEPEDVLRLLNEETRGTLAYLARRLQAAWGDVALAQHHRDGSLFRDAVYEQAWSDFHREHQAQEPYHRAVTRYLAARSFSDGLTICVPAQAGKHLRLSAAKGFLCVSVVKG